MNLNYREIRVFWRDPPERWDGRQAGVVARVCLERVMRKIRNGDPMVRRGWATCEFCKNIWVATMPADYLGDLDCPRCRCRTGRWGLPRK